MNTSRKGNGRENDTVALLQDDGWLVGSRRHIGGAGDLLAIKWKSYDDGHGGDYVTLKRLIEVKATKRPYDHFGPDDRKALLALAKKHGARAELAWWGPGTNTCQFIRSYDWP